MNNKEKLNIIGFLNNQQYEDFVEISKENQHFTQDEAFIYLAQGYNCFISGLPGTGKSYLIKKYKEYLQKYFPHKKVYVTSTTGLSALNIGGMTIHKYLGISDFNKKYEDYCKDSKLRKYWKSSGEKIKETDVLIVDEISMMSEDLLYYLYQRLYSYSKLKCIQIIFLGDFCQLPPVIKNNDTEKTDSICYDTQTWKMFNFKTIYLEKLYRTEDSELVSLLNNILKGNTDDVYNTLLKLNTIDTLDFSSSVILASTKFDIDRFNKFRQSKNSGKQFTIDLLCSNENINSSQLFKIAKELRSALALTFKNNDTVMITSNNVKYIKENNSSPNLANGSIGTIQENNGDIIFIYKNKYKYFLHRTNIEYYKKIEYERKGKILTKEELDYVISYYPIMLSYATTIHKSQGQTLSDVVIDLSNCWMPNLGYVALSRVKSLDGINLLKNNNKYISKKALKISQLSLAILDDIKKNAILLKNNDNELIQSIFNVKDKTNKKE